VAFTKFRTAQPFEPYLHQGNNVDEKESWPRLLAMTSFPCVELPGIEPDSLPGLLPSELLFRYVSFRFVPARYLRFRVRS
jgi:hypothetical protein